MIAGVEGVYDRWGYLPEKHDALTRLRTGGPHHQPLADSVALFDEHRAKGRRDTALKACG
jgi:hypothetical protein